MKAYLAGPHKNIHKNTKVAKYLRVNDIIVRIPLEEASKRNLSERDSDATKIREICINSIKECSFLIVDLDTYGLDTAWEIGFADGLGKNVIGYNEAIELAVETRPYERRTYKLNFMHGWRNQQVFHNIDEAAEYCKNKVIYVAGSFTNSQLDRLPDSQLEKAAKKLIFPKKLVENNEMLPKDHPFSSRRQNIKLLHEADIILAVLPRYGMDVSWQIGYAAAINKDIVGLVLEDDGIQSATQAFWDHWMHGWKEKVRVTNFKQLNAIIKGIAEVTS